MTAATGWNKLRVRQLLLAEAMVDLDMLGGSYNDDVESAEWLFLSVFSEDMLHS